MKRRIRIDKSQLKYGIPRRERSQKHRDFIKTLPCCRTGFVGNTDPAHISAGLGKGTALKTSDEFIVPLCREEHSRSHSGPEREYWGADLDRAIALARELWAHSGNTEYCNFIVLMFYQGK
jgi:hypothetical protein